MSASCYNSFSGGGDLDNSSIMTQSLDASMLRQSIAKNMTESFGNYSTPEKLRGTYLSNYLQAKVIIKNCRTGTN